jgi:hypothetical protein
LVPSLASEPRMDVTIKNKVKTMTAGASLSGEYLVMMAR